VLHLRHHRQPEGRRLLAPLGGVALADLADRRRGRAVGARHRAARGPDVPRQRVGAALRLPAGGLGAGVPRPEHDPEGDPGAAGPPPRHGHRRRPHHLDGCVAVIGRLRPVRAADDPTRTRWASRSCTPGA
jgi:hypothetical protein